MLVVNLRCSWPRASLDEEPIWEPTPRNGLVREAKDESSRGDLRAARSPMPWEKAIFARNTLRRAWSARAGVRSRGCGVGVGGEGSKKELGLAGQPAGVTWDEGAREGGLRTQ